MNVIKLAGVLALTALLASCNQMSGGKAGNLDGKRLEAAKPGDWMAVGRTYDEQRFSPLTKIDTKNVGTLGLAWYHEFDTDRGQEATPVVVDGVMYTTTAWSKVYAFDAKTGAAKWSFDPKVEGKKGFDACCDVVNRGVAIWKGKVCVATLDGLLVALNAGHNLFASSIVAVDADTGDYIWHYQTAPGGSWDFDSTQTLAGPMTDIVDGEQ